MVAQSSAKGFLSTVVLALAVLIGIGIAAGVATAPAETLDALAYRSGLAALYPAAIPVGVTMRTALALLAGSQAIALIAGPDMLARVLKQRSRAKRIAAPLVGEAAAEQEAAPVVRRADSHPDAPPRRPIRASSEFGAPLPIAGEAAEVGATPPSAPASPPREAELPADLDQPLAAFDPAAIPDEPLAPAEPLPPLVRTIAPPRVAVPVEEPEQSAAPVCGPESVAAVSPEFASASPQQVAVEPADEEPAESISALLARLERGRLLRRRETALPTVTPAPAPPAETLDDTLARLRQLAAR